MWIKLVLFGFLAICLLPDSVFSQGFCDLCKPSCNVKLGNAERRLNFFQNSMYYFATDNVLGKDISWDDAKAACKTLFSRPAWPGKSGNLASLKNKEEYDFIEKKLDSLSTERKAFIGGKLVGSDWTWIDGTPMNKTLIEGDDSLWASNNPSGDGKAMEIMTRLGLNDLSEKTVYPGKKSFVCKIPCSNVLPDECSLGGPKGYKVLDEVSRSTAYGYRPNCDQSGITGTGYRTRTSPDWKGEGWYKMVGQAGSRIAEIGEAPVSRGCGTAYPGYMNTQHPTVVGQTDEVEFCFDYSSKNKICHYKINGKVTKCGENNYVYYLPETPACQLRYCAVP